MEKDSKKTDGTEVTKPWDTNWYAVVGATVGFLVAFIGIAFANDTFSDHKAVIGVGFIALCTGLAFEWYRLQKQALINVSAGYLLGLGITLGVKLKAPAFWLPLIVGLVLFVLGIIIRQYAMNSKQSPPT
ncbi:MAG: hypothetical protein AAB445_03145 [Patescibacteria group bacterium]